MPVIASAEDVCATRRRASSNGTGFWLTSYIGANRYSPGVEEPPGRGSIYPMAFLVEQDPEAIVGAHYHQADQFQVIVGGAGRLGTHAVAEGAVHFAGAWTAYGPLAAGQGGLHYFTLRNGWDPGARYMEFPDNRATLRSLPRRHREAVGEVAGALGGLAARRHQLNPGESVTGPDPGESGGQFWLVLAGSMQRDGVALPPRSCVFIYPHEPAFAATGGPEGLTVLMLQFPRPDATYGYLAPE